MDIYNEIMKLTAIYSFYDSKFEENLLDISENDTKFMFLNRNTHSNNIYRETKKKIHKILKIFTKKHTNLNKIEIEKNTVLDINTDIDKSKITDKIEIEKNTVLDIKTDIDMSKITDKIEIGKNKITDRNRNIETTDNNNTTNNIITDRKLFNLIFNKILKKLKKRKKLTNTTKTPTDFNTFKILKTLKHDTMYFRPQSFYEIATNTKLEPMQQTSDLDFTQDCIFCHRAFKIDEIDSHIKQELESINKDSKHQEPESTNNKTSISNLPQKPENINKSTTTNSDEPQEIQIKVFFISLQIPNINTDNITITVKKPVTVYKLKQKIFELTNLSISKQKILIDTNVLKNSDLIENNIVFLKLKKKH